MVAGAIACAPVLGLAAAQGGFFPTAWGWASIPLLWCAALAMALRVPIRLAAVESVFLAGTVAFALWVAASIAWSIAPAATVLELERLLVYVGAIAAVLLTVRTRFVRQFGSGLLVAIFTVALVSLLTRLTPDRVRIHDKTGVYRLAEPIGYWNGLGIFAAMGTLIAIAYGVRARSMFARAAAAAAVPVLLLVLYLTFGRGAWIALAVGWLAAVAVDRRRLQFIAGTASLVVAPALLVWFASTKAGLTIAGSSAARGLHDGHRVALALVVAAAVNAAVAAGFAYAEPRVTIGAFGRRLAGAACITAAAVALGIVLWASGGPSTLVRNAYDAFTAPAPRISRNLNRRLFSFSGTDRAQLWRLAWNDANDHPVLGAGAGTYERYFLAHQPHNVIRVRDAHGLYLETLAELGPIGLAILAAVLATPLFALRFGRHHPVIPGIAGAYVAFLVHAGVDWDWELPGVTLVGLLCGAAILVASRRFVHRFELPGVVRAVGSVVAIAAAAFAAAGLIGNLALSRSASARETGSLPAAAADAHRAQKWMPWSAEPWLALGRAQLAAHQYARARLSFEKALSIDRGDWRLWYYLGAATAGRTREHALREAARLFPQSGLTPTGRRSGK